MSIQVRNDRLVDILRADFSALNHDHSGLGTPIALNDLTDAQITSGDLGDYLRNNGAGQWVDVAVGQLLTDLLTVDGTGSLLDADLLDGQDAASFQPTDPTLTALASFNTNGLLTQTAADTFTGRTIIAPAAGITVTNGDGVAGNPTLVLANDLAALEGLGSTGIAVRSATDTWVQRSIAAGTALGVTNGNGVSGNPTVAVTDVELLAIAGLTSAADQLPYFTGSGTAALTTLTAFIRTLLDDATQGAAQATLGVVPGTNVQPQDATLTALAAFNTNGLLTQTAADTFAGRTLTAPAAGFTITNPAGIAGNPTFVLANDLSALEGLGSVGLAVRSASDTWVQRTITAGAAIGITDGNGVSSNPIVAVTDVELLALAGLTSAADQLPYFTGSGTAALTTLTSFIRTLLDDATQGAAQATLGVTPGQPLDAFLTSIALLGTAADRMIYTTAVDTAAETVLSAFARSFLDDASEAVFKATVNLETGVDVQAWDTDLDALAALAATAGLLARTGAGAFAVRALTAPAAGITVTNGTGAAGNPTLVLANDLAGVEGLSTTGLAVRSATDTWLTRSIASGTAITVTNGDGVSGNPSVAVSDVELLAIAGLTSAADSLPYFTGSGTAALTTLTSFIRTLLDDATQGAAQATLGLAIGTNVQAWDADLDALAALAATAGMLSRTGAGAFAVRTLTAPAAGITISNPTGSAGNPTWALANDLAAAEGLSTNGLVTRTATDAWTTRSLIAPAAGITVTNPAGIAGDPTLVLANDLAALEGLASTGIAVRSAADTWVQRSITAGDNILIANGSGATANPIITSVSPFDYIMRLPLLRAFWPMSVVDSDGNPVDITGNGQHMIRQGNPTYAMHPPIPYIAFDGTGDYLRRTTEPQLEINANTFSGGLAVLMFGGWFWVNNATAEYTLMAKDDRAGQRSFRLYRTTGSLLGATIGTSGGAEGTATSGTWFFAALTLFGSGLRSFLNGTFSSQVTPLSITTTTAPFTIGGDGAGTQLVPGRAALCFLCNGSSDAALIDVYDNTRGYFGV